MTPDPCGKEPDIGADVGRTGHSPTRRQALALAGGTVAIVGAALGPFSHLVVSGAADGDEPPEITLTSWLIGLELAVSDLYDSVRTSSAFDLPTQALAVTCGGQHNAQAATLGAMVTAAGGEVPTTANAAFLSEYKPKVADAADGAAKAGVFADIENSFAATYYASLDTLVSSSLATIAAQVLATDAAHAVAWSAAANGAGSGTPVPTQDAIPQSQTDAGQFDQDALSATGTTTPGSAGPATTTGASS